MENGFIIGALVFAVFYYLSKLKKSNPVQKVDAYSDILNNDQYKAKGQWEK